MVFIVVVAVRMQQVAVLEVVRVPVVLDRQMTTVFAVLMYVSAVGITAHRLLLLRRAASLPRTPALH